MIHAQKSREPERSPPFDASPCTPPPQHVSPQPLTPKPSRFVSPPRTPLPKLFTNLTPRASAAENRWDEGGLAPGVASISRPESACSNYSSSSDSSLDSLTTFTTAGGSCASPDTEASFFAEETDADADADPASLKPGDATRPGGAGSGKTRVRKTKWTAEMDGHLWRTYIIYQQDPKITPFYVLPGQVPPLGVCCKVAREAKRSWKEAKMGDGWRGAPSTPRPKRKHRVRETGETVASGNRGDVLRKASPYSWPASEASTRRRLRELCRGSYGPSVNPHREYRQQRRQAATTPRLLPPRSSNVSPSPLNSATSERIGSRDAFLFSTRSIALSLTTSTASTMSPNGLLAAIAAGYDVKAGTAVGFGGAGFDFGENLDRGTISCREPRQRGVPAEDMMSGTPTRPSGVSISGLLPPLELKSSSSSYGTWPRRLKRQEALQDLASDSFVLPPSRRARRGTLGDLFGNPPPASSSSLSSSVTPAPAAASAAASTATVTRSRGFTIGASTFSSRRRYRPVAPLLTVTGPVSYDADESLSPLASRQPPPTATAAIISSAADDAPKRLGSPFERKEWREEDDADDLIDKDDEPSVGIGNGRPVKRPRE